MSEEPQAEDFEDYEDFIDAKIGHQVEKSMAAMQPPAEAQVEAQQPPPPPYLKDPEIAAEIREGKEKADLFADIATLGEMATKDSAAWNDPLFRRGLANRVMQWNSSNDSKAILIPREMTPFGDVEEVRPEKMVLFQFDSAEERDRILRNAANFSGDRFRRIWSALRQAGYYPEHGRPTFHETKEDFEAEKARHRYGGLSQAAFENLREKEGARRW